MKDKHIVDFKDYADEKDRKRLKSMAVTLSCLKTFEDITQEINDIMFYLREVADVDYLPETIKEGDRLDMYITARLCSIHGKNLQDLAQIIARVLPEINDEELKEIDKEIERRTIKYAQEKETMISKRYEKIADIIEGL